MWIAKQSRNANDRGNYLSQERTIAVANQQVWLLLVAKLMNALQCLLWMHRQVWSKHTNLSINGVTEDQPFGDDIITFRIEGKIFLCLWLGGGKHDIKGNTEPRFALKLTPERNEELREQFSAVTPAWHWNKKHWSDVYYELLDDSLVTAWIKESYDLVVSKLPKAIRVKYQ